MKKWVSLKNSFLNLCNRYHYSNKLTLNDTKDLEKTINDRFKSKKKSNDLINKLQSDIKIDNKENFLLNQNFIKNNIDIVLEKAFKNTLKEDVINKTKLKSKKNYNINENQDKILNERMNLLFDKFKETNDKANENLNLNLNDISGKDINLLVYELNCNVTKYNIFYAKLLYQLTFLLSTFALSAICFSSKLVFYQPFSSIYLIISFTILAINKIIYKELINVAVISMKINVKTKEIDLKVLGNENSIKLNLLEIKYLNEGSWFNENTVNIITKDGKKYILINDDIIHHDIINEIKKTIRE